MKAGEAGPRTPGDGARNVAALLSALHQDAFTGTVVITGAHGGRIHLREGLVGAIETPGTPSLESVLAKTGRVAEEALSAWRHEGGEGVAGCSLLVTQGLVGPGEMEIVARGTLFEGAFAMALSRPESWQVTPAEQALSYAPGLEPQRLVGETARRLALVSRLWGAPGDLARAKARPSSRADHAVAIGRLSPRYQALLAMANGRRTTRDMAFALGRGLSAVMLDLIRMSGHGFVVWESMRLGGRPSTAPRSAATRPSAPVAPPGGGLPRRSVRNHVPDQSHGGPQSDRQPMPPLDGSPRETVPEPGRKSVPLVARGEKPPP